MPADLERAPVLVDPQLACADDRRLPHLPTDHCRMRRHAARGREDSLSHEHPVNIVRDRLASHEDDLFALSRPLDRVVCRKHHLAAGGAGRRRQSLRHGRNLLPLRRIETWGQQLVEGFRIDEEDGLLRRDQVLGDQVRGDDDGRVSGALAAARLQHEQPLVLNRELEVLDVLVVLFEPGGDLAQLLVGVRQHQLELADRLRCADARDDVLALRVDQKLPVKLFLAGRGVARKADPGGRAVARIAEHHHLHVDGRADVIRDVVDPAVSCARGFIQDRNTASRAIVSCVCGSCGNGRPVRFATTPL